VRMNIIGKIFVFAVFVMSLVFMSFAIALFSTHTNWREEITRPADQVQAGKPLGYKLQLDEAKKERETLTAEIAKLTAEVAASEAARDQIVAKIQTALGEKDKELQSLRKAKDAREDERENAQTELAMTRTELEKATKTVEGLRDDIRGMQKKVDEQVTRTAKLAGELHEKESFLEIATERKAQLEKQVANARLLLKQHGLAIESLPRDHVPTAGGVVTAVADDSIEVTLGGDDGVQMGHFLEVYRNDEYLGRVQVISVKPDRSVGRVIREFKRGDIQPGDRVATRLKA
jgi:septal ring factor EnvC (AmiA/AmiB activator)